MQTQPSMREAVLNGLPALMGSVIKSVLASSVILGASTAEAAKGDATFTVVGKKHTGDINVGVSVGGGLPAITPVHVGLADSLGTIATNVAAAVGHGATAAGNKVTVPAKDAGGKSIVFGTFVDTILVTKVNIDGFVLGPLPAGTLYFASNSTTGQSTLDGDVLISAGFANGLSPVSFTASAGESINELASSLNAALDAAGYVTSLVDPLDVEVFADGAVGPAELDFSVTPTGASSDDGISYGVRTEVVPEPGSWALMLAGLGICGLAACRARR